MQVEVQIDSTVLSIHSLTSPKSRWPGWAHLRKLWGKINSKAYSSVSKIKLPVAAGQRSHFISGF